MAKRTTKRERLENAGLIKPGDRSSKTEKAMRLLTHDDIDKLLKIMKPKKFTVDDAIVSLMRERLENLGVIKPGDRSTETEKKLRMLTPKDVDRIDNLLKTGKRKKFTLDDAITFVHRPVGAVKPERGFVTYISSELKY